ncbi:AraC family transcriptional regulator [Sporomusa aerivorans]
MVNKSSLTPILLPDVATETGFFDQSHFHKAFQRKFGTTPKRYMQR